MGVEPIELIAYEKTLYHYIYFILASVSNSGTPVTAVPDQSSPGKPLTSQSQTDGVSQSTDSRPRSFSTGAGFVPSVHGHKWKKAHMHVCTEKKFFILIDTHD